MQLLDDLRRVVDHRIFNGEVAAAFQNRLVVRRGILPGVAHAALFHCGLRAFDVPVALLEAAEGNAPDCAQMVKVVHRGGCDEIDVRKRPVQNGDAFRNMLRGLGVFRYQQKFLIGSDGDAGIVVSRVADGKLRGVGERKLPVKRQAVPGDGAFRNIRRLRL